MIAVYRRSNGIRAPFPPWPNNRCPLEAIALRDVAEKITNDHSQVYGPMNGIPHFVVGRFLANVYRMTYVMETKVTGPMMKQYVHVISSWRLNKNRIITFSLNFGHGSEAEIDIEIDHSMMPEEVTWHAYKRACERHGRNWSNELHACYIGPPDGGEAHKHRVPWVDHYSHLIDYDAPYAWEYDARHDYYYPWVGDLPLSRIPDSELLEFIGHPVLNYLVADALVKGDRYWERYEKRLECPTLMLTL